MLGQIHEQLKSLPNAIYETMPNTNALQNCTQNVALCTAGDGGIKPTVMIKPKNNTQRSSETIDEIRQIGNDIMVRDVKNISGGGIVLTCETANETMKVKQLVLQQTNDKYEVQLPTIKKPRIKISNVLGTHTGTDVLNEIKTKNEPLRNADIKILKFNAKRNDNTNGQKTNDIIAEVDGTTFDACMRTRRVCIGWHSYNVTEHLYLKRCYKCCGFSHVASDCKHHVACSKCAGTHKAAECDGSSFKCVNCTIANEKYGLNLDTSHHAWSKNCSILNRRLKKLKDNIQYNVNTTGT